MYGHPVKNVVWHRTNQDEPERAAPTRRSSGRPKPRKSATATVAVVLTATVALTGVLAYQAGRTSGANDAVDEANRTIEQTVRSVQNQAQERIDACWEAAQSASEQTTRLTRIAETIAAADRSGQRLMIIDQSLLMMAEQAADALAGVREAAEKCH